MRDQRRSLLAPAAAIVVALVLGACSAGDGPALTLTDPADVPDPLDPSTPLSATVGDVTDLTATVGDVTDQIPGAGPAVSGRMTVRVDARLGHDTAAWTQGLVFDDGRLYESRGQLGESALTEIDPLTGEVLRSVPLADDYFGEGIAHVEDRFIMLTWQNEVALVFDQRTFEQIDEFEYIGEGWGLCYDGLELWMSNGTDVLTRRDPNTFEALSEVRVRANGEPIDELNELECIGGHVWANVWRTDTIVVIEPRSGDVVATIDASGLLSADERAQTDVLNGIAYDPEDDTLLVTGKEWPAMFEITPVPLDAG